MDANNENPLVFISYSWDDEAHKEWVLQLANRLLADGINVVLDRYVLSAGKPLQIFIERYLAEAEKVIIIFTPIYKQKADNRKGGAGYEYNIINTEFFEKQENNTKFIPVLRKGSHEESIPPSLRQILHVDFTENANFERSYEELLEGIHNLPSVVKPVIGKSPDKVQQKKKLLQEQNGPVKKKNNIEDIKKVVEDIPIPTLKVVTPPSNVLPNGKPTMQQILGLFAAIFAIFLFAAAYQASNTKGGEASKTDTINTATTETQPPATDTAKPASIATPTNKEITDNPAIRAQADNEYRNEYYKTAADKYLRYQDFLSAEQQFQLGYLYEGGYGVTQNYTEAMKWYRKAADNGSSNAMNYIGLFYHNGRLFKKDYSKALEWYKKAADKGNTDGMYNIAVLYERGEGVNKDTSKAKEWYQKAADKEDEEAKRKLKELSKEPHFPFNNPSNSSFLFRSLSRRRS